MCMTSIGAAIFTKLKNGKRYEALTLGVLGFDALFYGGMDFFRANGFEIPLWLRFSQFVVLSTIVPLTYMYFSRQMGRRWANHTILLCWALCALVFLPNCIIMLPESSAALAYQEIRPFSLNVVYGYDKVYSIYMADLALMLQSLLTFNRMIYLFPTMRKYGLVFNEKMYAFGVWWMLAILFILFETLIQADSILNPVLYWVFFIGYSTLVSAIFTLIAYRFDLHPVVLTADGQTYIEEMDEYGYVVEVSGEPLPDIVQDALGVDSFVQKSREMATRLRTLMEVDKLYLRPEYNAEEAIAMLGTNRTYFARMMTAEFGMKFTDYLNAERLKYAKELLLTTEKSITEVAFESGFNDLSYFGRKFKDYFGQSPASWRKDSKEQQVTP